MTLSVPSFLWNFVQDIKVVPNKFPVWVSVHFVKGPILSRTQSISINWHLSHFSELVNYPEILLECGFWFSRSGWGPGIQISNKLLGDAELQVYGPHLSNEVLNQRSSAWLHIRITWGNFWTITTWTLPETQLIWNLSPHQNVYTSVHSSILHHS